MNLLHKNATGEAQMTPAQIRSAEIYLKKVIPDLQSHKHSGDAENPIEWKATISFAPAPSQPDSAG